MAAAMSKTLAAYGSQTGKRNIGTSCYTRTEEQDCEIAEYVLSVFDQLAG